MIASDAFNNLAAVILKHAIFLSEFSEFIHITRRIGKLAVRIGAIVQPLLWQHILRFSYKPQYAVVVGYDLPKLHKLIVFLNCDIFLIADAIPASAASYCAL